MSQKNRPIERPVIYGVYPHVWLRELSSNQLQRLTLAEIPDERLDELQELRVDWLWLIGAWQTGFHGRSHAISHPDLRGECRRLLSDFALGDMVGSPYAIQEYKIHSALGGDKALAALRKKLARRGIKLMLDFVPNHTACDHRWVSERPSFYVRGGLADLDTRHGFFAETVESDAVIMFGRDPHFGPWTDTAQVDWRNPALVDAMAKEVARISDMCDGLRCDMAMLNLNEVFRRTWGAGNYPEPKGEPWTPIIAAARAKNSNFAFLAEVYWGMEERLIKLGFNWTYDKVLYDRLRHSSAADILVHLRGSVAMANNSFRFLENHDESRAASAFPSGRHEAAAIIAATLPGPLFVHHGQMQGRRIKLPIQLGRAPAEPVDEKLVEFYRNLLRRGRQAVAEMGEWHYLERKPAWEGSTTFEGFVAGCWKDGDRAIVSVVNFAPTAGQCYLDLSGMVVSDGDVELKDLLTEKVFHRKSQDLRTRGLYVDLPAWQAHVFQFRT